MSYEVESGFSANSELFVLIHKYWKKTPHYEPISRKSHVALQQWQHTLTSARIDDKHGKLNAFSCNAFLKFNDFAGQQFCMVWYVRLRPWPPVRIVWMPEVRDQIDCLHGVHWKPKLSTCGLLRGKILWPCFPEILSSGHFSNQFIVL